MGLTTAQALQMKLENLKRTIETLQNETQKKRKERNLKTMTISQIQPSCFHMVCGIFPSITAALSSLRQGLYDHESQKYLITDPLQNSLATLVQANAMVTIMVMVMMVVIIVVINYAIYLGGNKTDSQTT